MSCCLGSILDLQKQICDLDAVTQTEFDACKETINGRLDALEAGAAEDTWYQPDPAGPGTDGNLTFTQTDEDGPVVPAMQITVPCFQRGPILYPDSTAIDKGIIRIDGTEAAPADLGLDDYGLSRNVSKPLARAATQAELTHGNASTADVAYDSMMALFGNSAAEPALVVTSVMNNDGSLGTYRRVQNSAANSVNLNNGAMTRVAGACPYNTQAVPNGRYTGQTMSIYVIGGAGSGTFFTGTFAGVSRDRANGQFSSTTYTELTVRSGESLDLTWDGGVWRVMNHNRATRSGVNFRENEDGTVTMFGQFDFTGVPEAVWTAFPFPLVVSNPNDVVVNMTDAVGAGQNPGDPLPAADGSAVFAHNNGANTPGSVILAWRSTNGSGAPGVVDFHIENARVPDPCVPPPP